ncbi:hypothetical protein FDO65_07025 [Nakamurella flava]|uniref:Uncharacterized protein n=1 Tax=Nakamurella flava TaxID=2576308 RepID=A0A4U6QLE3_9ACTN|nr:phage tail tape measure protein [Nakamurella flava]TKV61344.1 hypothetical protein FDO65_07025 [Nakamurella flava]
MPVEIASAYVSIVPTLKPLTGNLSRIFQPVEQAGQDAGDRAGDNSGKGFLGGFGGLIKGGVAGIALAAGAAFTDAFVGAMDAKKSMAKLEGSLGLDPAETQKLGKTAGALYSAGYGESIAGLTDTLGVVKSSIKGLNDADLQKVTGKALSFASAFDTDVSESISSVNTLINSGLVTDANQAFDLLTKASQKVPASLRGDVMDASDEYSQFFRTLGFSSDQAFDVLVKGSEKGAFGIDKAGDAIKEFTIRSTDMSASSVAAYEAIGLNAQDMSNSILQGGDVAQGATQKIIDGILGIKDPSEQANTAIALFGTQMEDMNVADIPQFLEGLKGTSGALGDTAGAADKMDAAMGSTSSGFELFWRNIKTNLVDFISNTVLPKLAEFGNWFNQTFGPTIAVAGEWIRGTLIPAFSEVGAWISGQLAPVIQDLTSYLVNDLIPAWGRFVEWWQTTGWPILEPILAFIRSSIENLVNVVRSVIDVIGGVLSGDWSRVWDGIKGIFSGIWDQILNVLNTVWGVIQGVVEAIGPWVLDKLTSFAGFLAEKGSEFLGWIWNGITAKAEEVKNWFTALPGVLWDKLLEAGGGAVAWVTGKGSEFIGWIKTGLENGLDAVLTFFSELPSKAWQKILDLKDDILAVGGKVIEWIGDGIKNAAHFVWDALTSVFQRDENETPAQQAARTNGVSGLAGGGMPFAEPQGAGGGVVRRLTPGRLSMAAGGGVLPGYAPGIDNIHAVLSPGEAVMVPEWTRMVGVQNVYKMNRAARAGRFVAPDKFLGREMFAGGGVAGLKSSASSFGESISKRIAEGIKAGKDKEDAASSLSFGGGRGGFLDGIFNLGKQVVAQATAGAGGFSGNGQWGPENYSGNAANTAAAIAFTKSKWGLTDVFGWRASGSVGGSDHPKGKAMDAMIPNYASQQGISLGTSVADWFVGNPNAFGTKYVIWRDRINQGGSWGPYSHPGGNDDNLAHRNHVHVSFLSGAGQFSGQAVGDNNKEMGSLISKIAGSVASKFGLGMGGPAAGDSGPAPVQGGAFIPNVERWRPMAEAALRAFGYGPEWVSPMLWQMTTESSGNPNALNDWDRNFPLYGGSKGLLQTIQPTFESALRGTPYENLIPRGPYDPWANMLAAVSYVKRNYGGPGVWNKAVGGNPNPYDTGGWLMPGQQGINLLNKPEAVLRPEESAAYIKHAKTIGTDGAATPTLVIKLDNSDPLQVAVAKMIDDGFVTAANTVPVAEMQH